MDDKQLTIILERYFNRFNKYNTDVLKKLGETIKKYDGLTPSEAHRLTQQLKLGKDVDELVQELSKQTEKSVEDVYKTFEKVAKDNLEFSEVFYKAKNKEFVDYKNNTQLVNLAKTLSKDTSKELINLTKTKNIGFTMYDKVKDKMVFKPLKKVYNELLDEALYNVTTGTKDYQSAMRNTIKSLAKSGVKTHEDKVSYESGYSRRIDSSVKQCILTGLRQTNIEIQNLVGKDFGADGYEISAHSPCADDHIDIQGKQFTKKEFEKLNGSLTRPIGELNCRHFVFSIVMGVSQPSYSNKMLNEFRQESQEKIEYEGKTYTRYEATQIQRKLETAIRQQKDYQIIARSSGDKKAIAEAQDKIKLLTEEYSSFSKSANLPTYKENLTVSGYHKVSTK